MRRYTKAQLGSENNFPNTQKTESPEENYVEEEMSRDPKKNFKKTGSTARFYSVLMLFTGLAVAALTAW